MNRFGAVGVATPCLVHGCTIKNQSNNDVYVRILYETVEDSKETIHERRVEFQLLKGRQAHIDEEQFDKGSYQIRETIRAIEITRSNGQIQQIDQPFENVNGIELDWLFIIDNQNIQSIDPQN